MILLMRSSQNEETKPDEAIGQDVTMEAPLRPTADESTAPTLIDNDAPPPSRIRNVPASLRLRYENVHFLGEGGMGTVYGGWDPRLGRKVALKLLKSDDPTSAQRFLREARAQARVQHDNVCRIYEAGEVDGEPYIAMQLIEGQPLDRLQEAMTLEQKIKMMCDVCAALQEAHRLGLIHRDIKPGNILVEAGEDGTFKPYVVDFGLAREVSGSGQTITESIVGTPSYMSPEQAAGESKTLDRRTDVYSLGATLFDLIAGRPPFVGDTPLQVILKVTFEDAPPLRSVKKDVPLVLDTIARKALEHDRTRRYDSAKALGIDLQRFLDGEKISAKRPSRAYLAWKLAKKNKWATALVALVLVAGLTGGGAWVKTARETAEQARVAQELGEDVKEMELFLRSAYELPVHNMKKERAEVRTRLAAIEETMLDAGKTFVGPGHYALGRGHLALHEYEMARSHLEQSIARDYAKPEVHYALGRALGGLYAAAIDRAQRIADKDAREAQRREAEQQYLQPALRHLLASEGTRFESKAYIEGLVAYYEKRYDVAITKAEAAVDDAPWLFEAKKLEGDARFAVGMAARESGKLDEARAALEATTGAYKQTADMARSDGEVHEALAEAWIQLLEFDINQGRAPAVAVKEGALAACADALRVNPSSSNAYTKQGRAYFFLGVHEAQHGIDPRPVLRLAIENGKRAIEIAPDDATTHDLIGTSFLYIADYERKVNLEPQRSLTEAEKAFAAAIKVQPTFAWAKNDLGTALIVRADIANEQGVDPRPTVESAVDRFGEAVNLRPSYVVPYFNIAWALSIAAHHELSFGRDPRSFTARALEACSNAEKVDPQWPQIAANEVWARAYAALYEVAIGDDPAKTLERAEEKFRASIALNPDIGDTHLAIGVARHARILHSIRNKEDPTNAIKEARTALERALALDDSTPAIRVELGSVELDAARIEATHGTDPKPQIDRARDLLAPILKMNPQHAPTLALMADLHAFRAEHARTLHIDVEKEIAEGLISANDALAAFPDMPLALSTKGALLLFRARESSGVTRSEDAQQSASCLDKAFEKNPLLPEQFRALRAEARALQAR